MCCGPHIRPGCVLRKSLSLKPWLYWEDESEVLLKKRDYRAWKRRAHRFATIACAWLGTIASLKISINPLSWKVFYCISVGENLNLSESPKYSGWWDFFYNIEICTFHHFTQMVSPCTSWGLCSSLRSGKDIFTRSPKARSLQKVQRHTSEPPSHILSLRYERQPILSWSRGQCSAADNQFTADGCWFGKTGSERCKCWKGR